MAIRVLDELVVAQIAAGEVVERPASVVKELVENAIDAGARTIQVTTADGGQKLLRVSDDGHGILAQEVELAFAQHATSKLQTADDLERIRTLGFRGEALSSISAVSRVTLTTRHAEETHGTRISIEGGEVTQKQMIGAPTGTVITVEDLFFNTPARLKFLKKEATEKRHITGIVTQYAMAYPHIRFVLQHDGREVFRSSGSGQLADVMVKALGLDTFRQMIEIDLSQSEIRVYGYSTLPELHRSDRSHITLFVNGRAVQDTKMTFAVVQAYHNLLTQGKYPICVLMIDVPPDTVDVNVHPTKAEVRFSDPNAVFTVVQRAVREGLIAPIQRGTDAEDADSEITRGSGTVWDNPAQQLPMGFQFPSYSAGGRSARQSLINRPVGDDTEDELNAIPVGIGAPVKPRTLPVLRVVGQVGALYIIAEGPAGIYMVDQNAAHQRIVYEQLSEELAQNSKLEHQPLEPVTVDLAPKQAQLLEKHIGDLGAYGVVVEAFGKNAFIVRGIPALLVHLAPRELIEGLLIAVADPRPFEGDVILRYLAESAAVKAGQVLTPTEQQSLVRQLERCPNPLSSPDGRTVLIHMSGEQIAREFRKG